MSTPPAISQHAHNAAAVILSKALYKDEHIPVGEWLKAAQVLMAIVIQDAIDAATAELRLKAADRDDWQNVAMKTRGEIDTAMTALIETMASEVIEGCGLHEAVCLLISQRDNARAHERPAACQQ